MRKMLDDLGNLFFIRRMYLECRKSCRVCKNKIAANAGSSSDLKETSFIDLQQKIRRLRFGEHFSLEDRDLPEAKRLLEEALEARTKKKQRNWILNKLAVMHLVTD